MSYLALLLGEPSSGKTTSIVPNKELGIKGLNPKETGIIDVDGKGLPIVGWRKAYSKENGNYIATRDLNTIKTVLDKYRENPNIKQVIIDDYQFILSGQFKDDIAAGRTVGNAVFARYENLFLINYNLFELCKKLRDDQIVFILCHSERELAKDGLDIKEKMKTIGKATDKYMTPEGKCNVVLFAVSQMKDGKPHKYFLTQTDGEKVARSPIGMFDELQIKNDLGLVAEKIRPFI